MILSKQIIKDQTFRPEWLTQNSFILDIETTGFSPKFAHIYMLGVAFINNEDDLVVEQWFCEKDSDEYELLFKFNQLIDSYPTLYHFNGDQFDLSFIKKRMLLYNLHCHDYTSVDLLKVIRPFKSLFQLKDLKLKTVEAYFDYKRDDPFNGGQLIEVYKAYRQLPDDRLLQTLCLHNYEDMLGLLQVLTHKPLIDLLGTLKEGLTSLPLAAATLDEKGVHCNIKLASYRDYTFEHQWFDLQVTTSQLCILIKPYQGLLKHFFDNPKDYYYLINEDYAIHKSIGKFVAKEHRVQAKKENCYIKKEGVFLPAYRHFELPIPMYFEGNKLTHGYVSLEELVSQDLMTVYLQKLLMQL